MSPTFLPNAYVLSVKHPLQKLAVDDVILVNHPTYGHMIKRITHLSDDGIFLVGDNPESVTTEQMGRIQANQVLGKVIWHTNPPS